MIHMRPFNAFEAKNVKYLVDNQIEYATIQITETGLKKSILDATAPVRVYLKEHGIHDYDKQPQGTEHKRLLTTYILDEASQYPTLTSLYRPITKKGDPRMWVNKTKGIEFLRANDIFAIISHKGELYVVNLSKIDIPHVCQSPILTPLKSLVAEISAVKQSVSQELLGMIRDRMSDWVQSEVSADTGIGRTIETVLGISMNASTAPDYKGIELKSHRELAQVRTALFTQTPEWALSRLKSGRAIVEEYGYLPNNPVGYDKKTLQVTLVANKPNPQRLGLKVEQQKGLLEADEFLMAPASDGSFKKLKDVAVWRLLKLHERLLTKHKETFWIDVESEKRDGKEYFRCRQIEHTKNPLPPQFDILLDQGAITVDFLLSRPSGHGDTYSFKIKKKDRPLLFPESSTYML